MRAPSGLGAVRAEKGGHAHRRDGGGQGCSICESHVPRFRRRGRGGSLRAASGLGAGRDEKGGHARRRDGEDRVVHLRVACPRFRRRGRGGTMGVASGLGPIAPKMGDMLIGGMAEAGLFHLRVACPPFSAEGTSRKLAANLDGGRVRVGSRARRHAHRSRQAHRLPSLNLRAASCFTSASGKWLSIPVSTAWPWP